MFTANKVILWRIILVSPILFLYFMIILSVPVVQAQFFHHHFNITACIACDEGVNFSVRNFTCCLLNSKCCGEEKFKDR
uniref:Eupeucin-2 n=1 Tax=Mesobuthus eupeus TaxID=34648 RepID=V9P3I1_MESEU|nr:Eupeucin-2 precursor [Mesobuthus eupeus]